MLSGLNFMQLLAGSLVLPTPAALAGRVLEGAGYKTHFLIVQMTPFCPIKIPVVFAKAAAVSIGSLPVIRPSHNKSLS